MEERDVVYTATKTSMIKTNRARRRSFKISRLFLVCVYFHKSFVPQTTDLVSITLERHKSASSPSTYS